MGEIIDFRTNEHNIKTITSLEIAEMMEISHKELLRKLNGSADRKGICTILTEHQMVPSDYFIPSSYKDASGKENKCYLVTKLGCDFLANKFTGEKGVLFTARYVKRFDEMEQALSNPYSLPRTYKEALVQLLEQVEEKERLALENKEMKPKVEYHDNVLNKSDLITTTVIAKDLGLSSAAKLNQVMYANRIIYKGPFGSWCPFAEYEWLIKEGYADYKSYAKENAKLCLKWTEKGRKWIIDNYNEWVRNLLKD
jgi:phage regulator Rha-like protein